MKKAVILILLFATSQLFSQTFQWAKKIGGTMDDQAYNVSSDYAGNFYVTGYFRNTAMFDTITLTAASLDIFVAKYNPNGHCEWAVKTGGADVDHAYGIFTDSVGNSYIAGDFKDQANIGNNHFIGPGGFIAKLNSAGQWIWSRAITTTLGNTVRCNDITVDASGDCFVAGEMDASVSVGQFNLTSTGPNLFIAKIDQAGQWLWAVNTGGNDYQFAKAIALDNSGNCYVAGDCRSIAVFGNDSIDTYGSAFVSKLSSSGQWLWTSHSDNAVTSNYECHAKDMVVNSSGDIYITGEYRGEIEFGTDTLSGHFANTHCFISKINSSGQWLWAQSPGKFLGSDNGFGICKDASDNIYVSGTFNDTMRFGSNTAVNSAFINIFAAKLNSSDQWEWAENASGGSALFQGYSIASSVNGVCLVGSFNESVVIGADTLTCNPFSSFDIFITMLGNLPLNVTEVNDGQNLIYPNPTTGKAKISGTGTVELFNVLGKKVYSTKSDTDYIEFDLSNFPRGIYVYQIINQQKKMSVGKLIIE